MRNLKKLGLFYFSGTGNTKLVATHIGEEFTLMGWEVSTYNIESIGSREELMDMEAFDLIGMGAQVIGYTTPRRMNQFLQMLPDSKKGGHVFIFRTCGGVSETNYTASHSMMHILRKKNYDVFYERIFSIGSNWLFKFDNLIMQELYKATRRKIKLMCQEVLEGKKRYYEASVSLRLKKKYISSHARVIFPLLGKNMKVSESCTQCGLCVRNCPGNNINIVKGKIRFGTNCSACLRCIYQCPKQAIQFRFANFLALKNGYNVKDSLWPKADAKEETNGKIPPFFESYTSDDTM